MSRLLDGYHMLPLVAIVLGSLTLNNQSGCLADLGSGGDEGRRWPPVHGFGTKRPTGAERAKVFSRAVSGNLLIALCVTHIEMQRHPSGVWKS